MASILENYEALHLAWEVVRDATRDTEARVRITGVAAQLKKKRDFFLTMNCVESF